MEKRRTARNQSRSTFRSESVLGGPLLDEGLASLRRHEDRSKIREVVECFAHDTDKESIGPITMSMARIVNRRIKMNEFRRLARHGENRKIRKAATQLLEAEKG